MAKRDEGSSARVRSIRAPMLRGRSGGGSGLGRPGMRAVRTFAPRGGTRTVIKGQYTRMTAKNGRRSPSAVQRVKDSAEYYAHRPNEEGQRAYRPAFTTDADEMTKHEVAKSIEQSREPYVYRVVMSPGVDMSQEEVREWTREVMERAGHEKYIGFAHAGESKHTEHPHAHVLLFTDQKLDTDDFHKLRLVGDHETLNQIRHQIAAEYERQQQRQRVSEFDIED